MQSLYKFYDAFVGYALLKYYLYYLQIQHRIDSLDFIQKFVCNIGSSPEKAPESTNLFSPWLPDNVGENFDHNFDQLTSDNWAEFYEEILAFTQKQYGLPVNSALQSLVQVQQALIPHPSKTFPCEIPLQHDIIDYFKDVRSAASLRDYAATEPTPLESYPPGTFVVTDPLDICKSMWNGTRNFMIHVTFWELDSELLEKETTAYLTNLPTGQRPKAGT